MTNSQRGSRTFRISRTARVLLEAAEKEPGQILARGVEGPLHEIDEEAARSLGAPDPEGHSPGPQSRLPLFRERAPGGLEGTQGLLAGFLQVEEKRVTPSQQSGGQAVLHRRGGESEEGFRLIGDTLGEEEAPIARETAQTPLRPLPGLGEAVGPLRVLRHSQIERAQELFRHRIDEREDGREVLDDLAMGPRPAAGHLLADRRIELLLHLSLAMQKERSLQRKTAERAFFGTACAATQCDDDILERSGLVRLAIAGPRSQADEGFRAIPRRVRLDDRDVDRGARAPEAGFWPEMPIDSAAKVLIAMEVAVDRHAPQPRART